MPTHNHKFAPFGHLWTFWASRFLLFLRHDKQPFGPKSQTDANLPTLGAMPPQTGRIRESNAIEINRRMEVIEKYNVKFYVDQDSRKRISTSNGMLTGYISDWYNLKLINELYDDICKISNNSSARILETQSFYVAVMNLLETKIYIDIDSWEEDKNIKPDCILPTKDFKEIVNSWKKFMEK